MLILDRTQRAWATLSAVVCVVAGGVYVCYASWSANGPSGGSVLGLIFGSIAAAMMVFAGLLAARRRFPAARVGSAQFWMKGHLWIGTLTVPFALFHAGFGLGGRVEILLWVLFFAVILSGFWGLLLQQLLPRMMFENLPRETFIEQIPHLCIRFTAESDRLLSEVCGPLEVTLTPGEVRQFEPHLRPHFKDNFGKNRSLYPNTETDAVHFQKFLKRIYVEIPTPMTVAAAAVSQPAVAHGAPPAMKSVAQIKSPEQPTATPPAVTPAVASAAEAPAPKPDPKALLAAAKAKSAGAVPPATAAAAPEVAAVESGSAPAAAPAVQAKPDPRAMLAAAKAKQALAAAAANPDSSVAPTPIPPVSADTTSPAKPDPQAILAAARAKKAAAEVTDAPAEPVASPVDVPVAAVATKPDPKAMLAAAKAKREAAAAGTEPMTSTAESTSPVAEPAPPSEPPSAPAPAGKPDAKAMLAAMKAKKEAAAQQAGAAATSVDPAPAPQANPLGPIKTVKQPLATPQPDLVAAANLAPPTPAQVKELKLFYLELIRPQLPLQPATQAWREGIRRSIMVCQIRSDNQHPQFIPIFDQLLDLCEQRRQFAMIQRYHFWLHGWLLVHIPATVALYLVLVVHAVVALRVVPFGN